MLPCDTCPAPHKTCASKLSFQLPPNLSLHSGMASPASKAETVSKKSASRVGKAPAKSTVDKVAKKTAVPEKTGV